MHKLLRLALSALLLAAGPSVARLRAAPQGEPRDKGALAEDQDLLVRQLKRLRQTMEVLAGRFEAEGRTHAAKLLRSALAHVDERASETKSKTLEELMSGARTNIETGQSVQALESQEQVILRLEKLYAILTDRAGLENLEKSLTDLKAIQKDLHELTARETKLNLATQALAQQRQTPEHKQLTEKLAAAAARERELLARSEKEARSSEAFDLEALARELHALEQAQATDAAVAKGWKPEEKGALDAAGEPLNQARELATRAERLAHAAADLTSAAATARTEGSDLAAAQHELEQQAEREERHERAADDPTTAKAAEALRAGAEDLKGARASKEHRAAAAQALEQRAQALEDAAKAEEQAARAAQAAAAKALEALEHSESPAGEQARAARAALAPPSGSKNTESAQGSPSSTEQTREAAEKAAKAIDAAREELATLRKALAASQSQGAQSARKLEQKLGALPENQNSGKDAKAAVDEARAALERAAAAQAKAGESAAQEQASESAKQAARADDLLKEAEVALERAASQRQGENAASPAAKALAEQQQQLEETAKALEAEAQSQAEAQAQSQAQAQAQSQSQSQSQSSASESAKSSIQAARSAMQKASKSLSQGKPSQAAGEQEQAAKALEAARDAAGKASSPQSAEDKAKEAELKQEQEKIRAALAELAERNKKRENAQPAPSLDSAQASAKKAEQNLSEDELDDAQEQTAKTEQHMKDAEKELGAEEEQYQRLRQEELLFKIAEQVRSLIEEHKKQMAATLEVDQNRKPGQTANHTQRLRLKKIAKDEGLLGTHSGEMAKAIATEGSMVFAEVLTQAEKDLGSIARDMGEDGSFQSGERVQALQQDVAESLSWLAEALDNEKQRRSKEDQPDQGKSGQPPRNRLVPDAAELKLLRRMELDVLDSIDQFKLLHSEISGGGELEPLVREDIARLAWRHQRMSDLFEKFRKRLGLPDPSTD